MTASPAEKLVARLAPLGVSAAHRALDIALSKLSTVELAALGYDWRGFFARSKQIIPEGRWRSYGIMAGRGFGKTKTFAEFVTQEAEAGRAGRIALVAQSDDDTREIIVEGESGLIAVAPPWFKPHFEPGLGRLTWPNGARAFLYSAEAPGHFRGPQHDLAWADEIAAWPKATWAEAWSNMNMGLRLGPAKMVWSSTPKPVPIVREAVARSKKRPDRHVIIRGSTLENRTNLAPSALEDWLDEYGGTRLGRQELDGELLEDVAGAIFLQEWIDRARARLPPRHLLRRVVISVDPAITSRKGSDQTGIIVSALGFDDVVYVIADLSGKHKPEVWARIVIAAFKQHGADTILAEQNRGGELVAANLRAEDRAIVVSVKEVHARGSKAERAMPVATRYEKGRVAHVTGSDLHDLEEQMTLWDPTSQDSPDRLDALVHAVWELSSLGRLGGPSAEYTQVSAPGRLAAAGRSLSANDQEDDDEDDD